MKTIEIPEAMYEAIECIVMNYPEEGYESIEEFIRESIRKNL